MNGQGKPIAMDWTRLALIDDAVTRYWQRRDEVLRARGWLVITKNK